MTAPTASTGSNVWIAPLGRVLVELGHLTQRDLDRALETQTRTGQRLGTILLEQKLVSEDALVEAIAKQLHIGVFSVRSASAIPAEVLEAVPEALAVRHNLLPVAMDDETITVAMSDPVNLHAIDDVMTLTQRAVRPLIAPPTDLANVIRRMYEGARDVDEALSGLDVKTEHEMAEESDEAQLRSAAADAPIVRLVNSMIVKAIQERATDIHIEPLSGSVVVRYRIDGILYDSFKPPRKLHAALVSRIKVLSDLDIAERRLPQDGRFTVRIGPSKVDVRVSVMPTVQGEKVVLRLLDKGAFDLRLERLGMTPKLLKEFRDVAHRPWGMLLVSGPTGSGKTTTLYAALGELVGTTTNIVTVEDPVEYRVERVNQVQVHEKAGLTFARALRSFLRQDPDVVMVGEIRDRETADIAVRAALTGHFVFSTIHANDAITTATRLIDIGVEPYLVASAVTLVLAQRLVRRLCSECAVPGDASGTDALIALGVTPKQAAAYLVKRAVGCPACRGRGYLGRTAIYEALRLTPAVRRLIAENRPADEIREEARGAGYVLLRESGLEAVAEGITTPEEVVRVALDPT